MTLKSLVFMNYGKYELCICIIDHYLFSKEIKEILHEKIKYVLTSSFCVIM